VNRLQNRLILIFLAATLAPIGVMFWVTSQLIDYSLGITARGEAELDKASRALESTGREYYRQACDQLRREVDARRVPERFYPSLQTEWPSHVELFWQSGEDERFSLAGVEGKRLELLRRRPTGVAAYGQDLAIPMGTLQQQIAKARETVREGQQSNRRQGFTTTFIVLGAVLWAVSFAILILVAVRISGPIQQLTAGLTELSKGNLGARVAEGRADEIGRAIHAFNHMADQLQSNRERLVYLTQLASWQMLARKMAHEVKNSLTPIRLMVEEMVARPDSIPEPDRSFLEQGRQIIVDEVEGLERRIRAFSEFAAEPAVRPRVLPVNQLVEERVSFLRTGHPEVNYELRLAEFSLQAYADEDLVKGVLTNLLENAAEAVGAGGSILTVTRQVESRIGIEIHDSGPGLPENVRESLFQPTISFKKRGMGLGLSIARKSALMVGGDIYPVPGELGGAAFRVLLPPYEENSNRG
jgi:nitrogen fixation/metabolism regulation signal transduction histidine kinase